MGAELCLEGGGRRKKRESTKVTTETWYPWILAIMTYFWVYSRTFLELLAKEEQDGGLKALQKKETFPSFSRARIINNNI